MKPLVLAALLSIAGCARTSDAVVNCVAVAWETSNAWDSVILVHHAGADVVNALGKARPHEIALQVVANPVFNGAVVQLRASNSGNSPPAESLVAVEECL